MSLRLMNTSYGLPYIIVPRSWTHVDPQTDHFSHSKFPICFSLSGSQEVCHYG